jgi:iron(III) transport system substrate-binding protein
MRKKLTFLSIVAVGVATVLAACSTGTTTGDATKASGAKAGGAVNVLCLLTEQYCSAVTAIYASQTGTNVTYVRLSTGDGVARLKLRQSDPEFDAVIGGPSDSYYTMEDEGLLAKYISPNRASIPAADKDNKGYWTGMYRTVLGFCSNQSKLKQLGLSAPRSWDDLLNPKLKGLVGIADPSGSGTAYTALYTQLINNDFDEAKTFAYFKKLNKQVTQYAQTGGAPAQAAAQGEVAVGVVFTNDCVTQKQAGAKDLVITTPSDGTGPQIGGTALVQGAPHPAAAKKLLDWILTPTGQDPSTNAHAYVMPTAPKAKVDPLAKFPAGVHIVTYDARKAGQVHDELVQKFTDQVLHG